MSGIQSYFVQQKFLLTSDSTSSATGSIIVAGGIGINKNANIGGNVTIYSTSESTSSTSGALNIYGGLGISKKLYVGDTVNITNTLTATTGVFTSTEDSTDSLTGSIQIAGGISVKKNLYVGGNLDVTGNLEFETSAIVSTNDSTSTSSGALIVHGGVGIAKSLYLGGVANLLSTVAVSDTTDSSSSVTGSVTIAGGLGLSKKLYIGDALHVSGSVFANDTTDSTSTTTGGVQVLGGVGIAKKLYVGDNTVISKALSVLSTDASTSTSSGSVVIAGGMGLAGTLYSTGLNLTNTVTSIDLDTTLAAASDSNLSSQKAVKTYVDTSINNFATLIDNPTGFPNTTDSAITTTDGTREVTIAPTSASFDYYITNVKYTKSTSESIVISNVSGEHFIYYNGATLSETTTFSDALLISYAYIASVYWNATTSKFVHVGDERHGISMSPYTHRDLHYGLGTVFVSGLTPADFTIGDGSLDSHAQFSISSGVILDEDLKLAITAKPQTGSIRLLYLSGTIWTYSTTTGAYYSDNTKLSYNKNDSGTWGLQAVTDGNYVLGHIVSTNDHLHSVILGQNEYTTISEAQQAAANELSSLYLVGLPLEDWMFVATVIYQSNSTYANAMKGRVVEVSTGVDFIDWREKKLNSTAGAPTSHSNLSNLTADDHLQYVMVNGRVTDTTKINNTADTTGTSSGALQVFGGVSISKKLYVGDTMTSAKGVFLDTTQSTDSVTGSVIIAGGLGVSKNLYVGGNLDVAGSLEYETASITSTDDATSTSTGALKVVGGAGFGKSIYVGSNATILGKLYADDTTDATSTTTGGVQILGGVSIAKALYIGTNLNVAGTGVISDTTESTSTDTGAFKVSGGLGLAKSLYVGNKGYFGATDNTTSSSTGSLVITGGLGIGSDVFIGGELLEIKNAWGQSEERVRNLSSVITVAHTASATVYSLTVTDPVTVNVKISGYDSSTKAYTCICDTTYVFSVEDTAVVSLTGSAGTPENLLWSHTTSGWNFASGAFSFVDNGSGSVDIKFSNNGSKDAELTISTVKINKLIGITH